MAFLGWSFLSWDTLDGYLVPKKRERYQFLMDVWSNNHFPSKDLESKWTNHLYRVVSGSGSSLIVKKILFGPKAQVASHDFCSHPIAIGPWTKAVLSRKLRWSWNQISGGIGRFETVNHEATVTNISQVHLKKHISKKTCITDSQNSVISRSDSEKMRKVETWHLYHLTDLVKPKLFSNLPCTIRLVYDVRRMKKLRISLCHGILSWFRIVMWCHNCKSGKSSNDLFFGRSFVARCWILSNIFKYPISISSVQILIIELVGNTFSCYTPRAVEYARILEHIEALRVRCATACGKARTRHHFFVAMNFYEEVNSGNLTKPTRGFRHLATCQ